MSVSAVCDSIASIGGDTTHEQIATIAKECEPFLSNTDDIVDVVENSLCASAGLQRLALWYFVDRLAKQHRLFLDALRPKIVPLTINTAPSTSSAEWGEFVQLLESSFTILFGAPLVSLVLLQLTGDADGGNSAIGNSGRAKSDDVGKATGTNAPADRTTRGGHNSTRDSLDSGRGSNAVPTTRSGNPSYTPRSHTALTVHSSALRSAGSFVTKAIAFERPAAHKHALQVKTIDSQMAMHVANSYAPAKPVEIRVPELRADSDAPRGYMKTLPSGYSEAYEDTRRKRLRDIMARHRQEQDMQQERELLQRVRQEGVDGLARGESTDNTGNIAANNTRDDSYNDRGCITDGTGATTTTTTTTNNNNNTSAASDGKASVYLNEYADVQMPAELPRDEFGVKRGNFPLGVRFVRNAIASCGGAVELDVVVNRLSTLSNREAVSQFGNVREFLLIHAPTFRLTMESGRWIVRLTKSAQAVLEEQQRQRNDSLAAHALYTNMYNTNNHHTDAKSRKSQSTPDCRTRNDEDDDHTRSAEEMTWQSMTCPGCSKVVKGRNFARHHNSRRCITAQIALGLQGDYTGRGVIAELAFNAKHILSHLDSFDDGDIDALTACLTAASQLPRLRLASPRQFTPILKAIRAIRDRWMRRKGVSEMDEARVRSGDVSVAQLFGVLGSAVHRLPIAWIDMGEVIDMCHRFTEAVQPPLLPPPRPADPRIGLTNSYPGFLLCESELDDEDEPSGDEDEFSDDEAPAFTFAPPVDVAESLFTAGFARDTRRLQHRMRTAPPMVLQRVLQGDGMQTQREMYTDMHRVRGVAEGAGVHATQVRHV